MAFLENFFNLKGLLLIVLVFVPFEQLLPHMTDIGDIFHMQDVVTTILKGAPNPVSHGKGTQVANMDIAIHGRAARIHANLARFSWGNLFEAARQGIINPHNALCILLAASRFSR